MRQFSAKASATVANLGPGFDLMGLPLRKPFDRVTARWNDSGKIVIDPIRGGDGSLSRDPRKNVVGIVASALLKTRRVRRVQREKRGVTLTLEKGIPVASGLGGSAASAVASALAVNRLLGSPYKTEALLPFALAGETAASGGAHLDNVLPCLLRKPVLILSMKPLCYQVLRLPKDFCCVVVHPNRKIETKMARKLLPKKIPMEIVLKQSSNLSGMVEGLKNGNWEQVRTCCVDLIAEPARKRLIPGFAKVKQTAYKAGAYGCSISGSGPSVFALCKKKDGVRIGKAMQKEFARVGLKSEIY